MTPFQEGFDACLSEVPRRNNPYTVEPERSEWFRGWDAGCL